MHFERWRQYLRRKVLVSCLNISWALEVPGSRLFCLGDVKTIRGNVIWRAIITCCRYLLKKFETVGFVSLESSTFDQVELFPGRWVHEMFVHFE